MNKNKLNLSFIFSSIWEIFNWKKLEQNALMATWQHTKSRKKITIILFYSCAIFDLQGCNLSDK